MSDPKEEELNELDARTENELKKIKLSLEYGMDFSQSFASPDLPQETESQFLDYIQQWEYQNANRRMTTIFDRLGKPVFRPVGEMLDDEIDLALSKAIELLHNNSIRIDTLCKVGNREMYRFITEELFNVEIADIRIDGMMHCFTYEEFHPNHPYDIKNRCTEFIRHITDKEGDKTLIPWGLADQIIYRGQVYSKEELNSNIIKFHSLLNSLELNEHKYISVTLNETDNEATVIMFVDSSCIIKDQSMDFSGNYNFHLKCEYGWWTIDQFDTPFEIIMKS